MVELDAVKSDPRRYAKLATALVFLALGIWLCLSSLAAERETKPGDVKKNSRGGYTFTGSQFGDNKQPLKRSPTPKPSPSPTPSPKKKTCDDEQNRRDKLCKELQQMQQQWRDKCDQNYEQHAGECETMSSRLRDLETGCSDAQDALADCRKNKGKSQPNYHPSECDNLIAYVDDTCKTAWDFEWMCTGSAYSRNYQWCEQQSGGQPVQIHAESLCKTCRDAVAKFKQKCKALTSGFSCK